MDFRESYVMHNTLPLVFRYLSLTDILRCAQVCKLWNVVIENTQSWKTINLENAHINVHYMFKALSEKHRVTNLRLINCTLDVSDFDSNILKEMQIKRLEISETPSVLLNSLSRELPTLEALKAKCYASFNVLDLSVFSSLAHLTELKLYCNRQVDHLDELLLNLGQIRHLYLLGLTAESIKTDPTGELIREATQKMQENDLLESFGLDLEQLPINFHILLRKFVKLKKLRLENCRKWDCRAVLTEISLKPNFTHLELIEVNVLDGFRNGFSLCKNVTHFIIVLNTPRFNLEAFTSDVMLAIQNLSSSLKKLTWGFSDRYLNYFLSVTDRIMNGSDLTNRLILQRTFIKFESDLKYLLQDTEVEIKMGMNAGNLFD
ncbi:uncharacterized protein LOC126745043 [Anthonomus grandis grandis]|uniref:uncharacterized protein LOC126745043 n=1 Tax=Anthonomus grandis grandis TaxID=2921223 RepID=UPI002166A4FE|nr:uncharacterized protein LOC126745043 [Anthonomus grandis grandis]XP_050308681.1 uncharacterized protein LOC126745043 [Anthonomus grandis grandis]XP_050308682.1 uncharacterized protein LOC126745043 [Anthonomus grandis grandis]XP_050308683.1 uncharacterized protein LOC126745043 [Anthonomus grandis grandis]